MSLLSLFFWAAKFLLSPYFLKMFKPTFALLFHRRSLVSLIWSNTKYENRFFSKEWYTCTSFFISHYEQWNTVGYTVNRSTSLDYMPLTTIKKVVSSTWTSDTRTVGEVSWPPWYSKLNLILEKQTSINMS